MSVFDTSRVARSVEQSWSRVNAAWRESRVQHALHAMAQRSRLAPLDERIAFAGVVVAVAMAIHLAMLLFVELYPFPSRSRLIVPGLLFGFAVVAVASRRVIAAAARDRRTSR